MAENEKPGLSRREQLLEQRARSKAAAEEVRTLFKQGDSAGGFSLLAQALEQHANSEQLLMLQFRYALSNGKELLCWSSLERLRSLLNINKPDNQATLSEMEVKFSQRFKKRSPKK